MAPLITIPSMDAALGPLFGANHLEGNVKLVVKNTFLDVDETFLDSENVPGPLGFPLRFVSEPPPMGARSGIEHFDEEEEEEERESPSSVAASKEPTSEEEQETPIAALVRHTTFDPFEYRGLPEESMEESMGLPMQYMEQAFVNQDTSGSAWMGGGYPTTGHSMTWQAPVIEKCYKAQGHLPPEFDAQLDVSQQHMAPMPHSQQELATQTSDDLMSEQQWDVLGDSPQRFHPQSLSQGRSRVTGSSFVYWTVDAKKLRSNDRLTVSPLFKLRDGHVNAPPLPFKMTVTPKVVSDGKGGASFRKAKGMASIQVKCEAPREDMESYPIRFCLSAWSGREEDPRLLPARGPVTCNFAQSGICGLPKDCEIWDFLEAVDKATQTFVICLEVLAP